MCARGAAGRGGGGAFAERPGGAGRGGPSRAAPLRRARGRAALRAAAAAQRALTELQRLLVPLGVEVQRDQPGLRAQSSAGSRRRCDPRGVQPRAEKRRCGTRGVSNAPPEPGGGRSSSQTWPTRCTPSTDRPYGSRKSSAEPQRQRPAWQHSPRRDSCCHCCLHSQADTATAHPTAHNAHTAPSAR